MLRHNCAMPKMGLPMGTGARLAQVNAVALGRVTNTSAKMERWVTVRPVRNATTVMLTFPRANGAVVADTLLTWNHVPRCQVTHEQLISTYECRLQQSFYYFRTFRT